MLDFLIVKCSVPLFFSQKKSGEKKNAAKTRKLENFQLAG